MDPALLAIWVLRLLFLGLLFYPITWLLSAYFVRASEAVEREVGALAGEREGTGHG